MTTTKFELSKAEKTYAWTALLVFVILVLASTFADSFAGPDPWLTEWVEFAAKYAALAVAVHQVWGLSDALAYRLRNWQPETSDNK